MAKFQPVVLINCVLIKRQKCKANTEAVVPVSQEKFEISKKTQILLDFMDERDFNEHHYLSRNMKPSDKTRGNSYLHTSIN